MTGSPVIAVVTPTRNRLTLLRETMDSVAAQTFEDWEHLVVDDGSDDGTAEEVLRRAAADPRIRYVRRQGAKAGANVCRNLGIRDSRAEYVLFLDSDDLLRPECLEGRVKVMQRNRDLDFAVMEAAIFKHAVGDLNRLYYAYSPGDDLLRFLSHECPWPISGPVWRKDFLERIGGFDEGLLSMQDMEMHVRALSARARYSCFSDVDHDVRGLDDAARTSTRHFKDPAYIEGAEKVREKLRASVTTAGLLTWSRRRALAGLCFGAAQSWVRSGRLAEALRAWDQGCRQQGGPYALWIAGNLMLWLQCLDKSGQGLFSRLVHKWQGWARFRQEPALLVAPAAPEDRR
ncbi:MAG: glycosyltransferase family A protein [Phenylobacterium sp.]